MDLYASQPSLSSPNNRGLTTVWHRAARRRIAVAMFCWKICKSKRGPDQQSSSLPLSGSSSSAAKDHFKVGDIDQQTVGIGRERIRPKRYTIDEQTVSTHSQRLSTGGHVFRRAKAKGNARTHHGDSYQWNTTHYDGPNTSQANEPAKLVDKLKFVGMSDRVSSVSPAYADTCRWILGRPEYLAWWNDAHRHEHNGVLWIKGHPGSGKSTLMKLLLNHSEGSSRDGAVASFFLIHAAPTPCRNPPRACTALSSVRSLRSCLNSSLA